VSDAPLGAAGQRGVLARFLAAAAVSSDDIELRERLVDLARQAACDADGERDRALALLDRVAVWAAAALRDNSAPVIKIPDEIRNGNDVFVLYEAIGAGLSCLEASDRDGLAVLRLAQRAAGAGLDLHPPPPTRGLAAIFYPQDPPPTIEEVHARNAVLFNIADKAGQCLAAYAAAGLGDLVDEACVLAATDLEVTVHDRLEAVAFGLDRAAPDLEEAAARLAENIATALDESGREHPSALVLWDADGVLGALISAGLRTAHAPDWPLITPNEARLRQVCMQPPPHWARGTRDRTALLRAFHWRALARLQLTCNEQSWPPAQDAFDAALRDLIELTAGLRASGLRD
jgi:hypothetical protein